MRKRGRKTLEGEGGPFRRVPLLPPNLPHPPRTFLSRGLVTVPLILPCCGTRRGAIDGRRTNPGSGKFLLDLGRFGYCKESGYRTCYVCGSRSFCHPGKNSLSFGWEGHETHLRRCQHGEDVFCEKGLDKFEKSAIIKIRGNTGDGYFLRSIMK